MRKKWLVACACVAVCALVCVSVWAITRDKKDAENKDVVSDDKAPTGNEEKEDDDSATVWNPTILPGDDGWWELSREERQAVCHPRTEVASELSTSMLARLAMGEPDMMLAGMFDNAKQGQNKVKNQSSSITELCKREDAADALVELYKTYVPKEGNPAFGYEYNLQSLLVYEEIIGQLDDAEKEALLEEVKRHNAIAEEVGYESTSKPLEHYLTYGTLGFVEITTSSNEAEYSATPDAEEWIELGVAEMRDATNISQEVLDGLSTEEVARLAVEYPLLVNVGFYDDRSKGFESVKSHSNVIQSLCEREDAAEHLLALYKECPLYQGEEDNNDWYSTEMAYQTLLSAEDIFEQLDEAGRQELCTVAKERIADAQSKGYDVRCLTYYIETLVNESK